MDSRQVKALPLDSDMRRKKPAEKKIRVTLDLSPQFYERLERLERLVDAGTKANVIRQALQIYEFLAQKSLAGHTFRTVDKDGQEEKLVFLGASPPPGE